jgi:uncharacterized protein YbjT (DUF2867 family)
MTEPGTTLVTGATGHVGRVLVSLLRDGGLPVRALARHPDTADLPDGVDVVRGDLSDPATLDAALTGVASVFLLWPFLTAEGAPAVVDAIARHARHVVYLSAMSVSDDREPAGNGFWGEVEHLLERSGVEWTFLRAGGFATNTLGWADQIRTEGVVRWPYGAAARSLIHERDIAAVAARALTGAGHAGAKYVLTGPAAITQAEQARVIGEVTGHPVRWEELPPERARRQLLDMFGDPDFVDGGLAYWAGLVDRPEPVTDTVREVTGEPARTFRQWAVDHRDEFRPRSTVGAAGR